MQHLSLMIITGVVSLSVALYCFRLVNKFFKGGIFEGSIKTLGASAIFFSIAVFVDTVLDLLSVELVDAHTFHMVIEIIFFIALFYSVRQLYLAWKKLGHG